MRHPARHAVVVALIALTATACLQLGEGTTSSPGQATSTTATPGSTVVADGRVLKTVGCADATDEISIVCEAYDIISRNYVDDVSDLELAEAAAEAVKSLDGSAGEDDLVCALPSATFTAACDYLPANAEDSAEGAEAIVRGMASALDPNSVYLDEEAVALIQEEQQGQIEGIGALVTAEDSEITEGNPQCSTIGGTCRLLIVSTIVGTPAEAAGIQGGDILIEVDGESIVGWTLDEVTARVRGPAGSQVELTLLRGEETYQVTITRAAVVIPVVTSDLYGNIGYVRLNVFSENADEQLKTAILDLLAEGATELVFDLRDNPGGLLDTAIEVTSLFLPDGDVVVTQDPEENRSFPVTGSFVVPEDMPLVVIINRGSASASEVVSAVLLERGRATVTGENSFGKNTVQQQFSLSNGGAFKVTIARWVTPGGHDFGVEGVTPNVAADYPADLDPETVATRAAGVN